ncbi:MAG: hypothetical protein ACR2N9_12710 [Acidimicrobiia bacterium]
MNDVVAVGIALLVLAGIARFLYSSRVQSSTRYQATVVPLSNIMDVGFIVMSPAIVLLAGYQAPFVMLGICLVAIATGFAMSYNIRHFEPLKGSGDRLLIVGRVSRVALTLASVINIAYYTLLLVTLALWPFDAYSERNLAIVGTALIAVLLVVGWMGRMDALNRLADKTTAFNLSAVIAVVVAFGVYNIQEALGGRWELPPSDTVIDATALRQIIGLFAIVQGFEAARYIGSRFAGEVRISAMRVAQYISTVVFVALLAFVLILFVQVQTDFDATAIFVVSDQVGDFMPWLILLAALGSQTSAIIGATMSRSDMITDETSVSRRATFLILLLPAIAVFLLTDVTQAVTLASRVFATYFVIQAVMAWVLARRRGNWAAVAGFTLVALTMATIAIFGLPL